MKWHEQIFVHKTKKLLCVASRENKEEIYDNLNKRCVIDNKLFWKTVKPFLSDKVMTRQNLFDKQWENYKNW